jgi:hypothetical protein
VIGAKRLKRNSKKNSKKMLTNERKKKSSKSKRKRHNLLYRPHIIKNKNPLLSNFQKKRTKVVKKMIILKESMSRRSRSKIEKVLNREHVMYKDKEYKEMKKGKKKMSEKQSKEIKNKLMLDSRPK